MTGAIPIGGLPECLRTSETPITYRYRCSSIKCVRFCSIAPPTGRCWASGDNRERPTKIARDVRDDEDRHISRIPSFAKQQNSCPMLRSRGTSLLRSA
eukprot:s8_g3.t2